MSFTGEQTPVEPPEGEELSVFLYELEEARGNLLSASAQYVQKPTHSNSEQIVECANKTASSLYRFTKCVLHDPLTGSQEKGDIIATRFFDEDEGRVSYFNSLFGEKYHEPFKVTSGDKENLAQSITGSLEALGELELDDEDNNADDLLEELIDAYGRNLGIDINQLITLGSNSSKAKMRNVGKAVGKYSVDILKISAGVAIGTFIIKELERRQS